MVPELGQLPATNVPDTLVIAKVGSHESVAVGVRVAAASPAASEHSTVRSSEPAIVVQVGVEVSITVMVDDIVVVLEHWSTAENKTGSTVPQAITMPV